MRPFHRESPWVIGHDEVKHGDIRLVLAWYFLNDNKHKGGVIAKEFEPLIVVGFVTLQRNKEVCLIQTRLLETKAQGQKKYLHKLLLLIGCMTLMKETQAGRNPVQIHCSKHILKLILPQLEADFALEVDLALHTHHALHVIHPHLVWVRACAVPWVALR